VADAKKDRENEPCNGLVDKIKHDDGNCRLLKKKNEQGFFKMLMSLWRSIIEGCLRIKKTRHNTG